MTVHQLKQFFTPRGQALLPGFDDLWQALAFGPQEVAASFAGFSLHSAFQPIFDLKRRSTIGHEALLRAHGPSGATLSPEVVFATADDPAQLVGLDRLCRTLHALNFLRQESGDGGRLFLNVHPRHLLAVHEEHGKAFEAILKHCGIGPGRIVLEVLESGIEDTGLLRRAVRNYRSRGYRIAVDDFGRDHSNFERLLILEPDIVKFDRSLLLRATEDRRVRRVLRRLADIVHDLGAIAVLEGLEQPVHLQIANDAGIDWAQGYLLGRPQRALAAAGDSWPEEEQALIENVLWETAG
ncbi:MAG TPA: EAL domain-containing protein [Rhodocyclaceae bacterium]